MDKDPDALDLANNKQHQFLMGELAAALKIALNALSDIADGGGILSTITAKKTASEAITLIEALANDKGYCAAMRKRNPYDMDRLSDLETEFFHIRHFGDLTTLSQKLTSNP